MITTILNEKERYLTSLAVQLAEADRVITAVTSSNADVVEAESKSENARDAYELARTAFQPEELADLRRKLA